MRDLRCVKLLVVIAIIAILMAVFFFVGNPAGELAETRNNDRLLSLQTIMNSVRANLADQGNEQFSCVSGPIPTSTTKMASASGSYNIAPCLVPVYLFAMPFDPSASSAHYTSNTNYDTGYSISENSSTGQITLSAPYAELGKSISVTR